MSSPHTPTPDPDGRGPQRPGPARGRSDPDPDPEDALPPASASPAAPPRRPGASRPAGPVGLPSTAALEAFEAALRHGSFTGAARELGKTQGAISRQIAALEARVGRELFRRDAAGVHPTRAAVRLAEELPALLARLGAVLDEAARGDEPGRALRLALLPTFGTTWLIPRLPEFLRAHPEVDLEVSTSIGPVDLRRPELDAAIHYGEGATPGARAEPLFQEVEVVCCAPELRAREGLTAPGDLVRAPLLHLSSRPTAWRDWLRHHGLRPPEGRPGARFEHHLMVREAARAGLGVALLPSFVADAALRSGELVEPFADARRLTPRRYWLLVPDRSLELESLRAFRRWLRAAIDREGWS